MAAASWPRCSIASMRQRRMTGHRLPQRCQSAAAGTTLPHRPVPARQATPPADADAHRALQRHAGAGARPPRVRRSAATDGTDGAHCRHRARHRQDHPGQPGLKHNTDAVAHHEAFTSPSWRHQPAPPAHRTAPRPHFRHHSQSWIRPLAHIQRIVRGVRLDLGILRSTFQNRTNRWLLELRPMSVPLVESAQRQLGRRSPV